MKLEFPPEFILYDTEWTSWEGFMEHDWKETGKYREIIQIGALRVGENLTEIGSFTTYIKPVKNPELSDYIQELTHITQEKINAEGKTLSEALNAFSQFTNDLPLYSWGDDSGTLKENCELIGIPFILTHQGTSLITLLTPILAKRGIDVNKYTSGTLIKAFGKTGGRAHDAVNDMRNLLEVLRELK
jgi:inhibitor of KinA sporulation pathway (predicted exonuclease)